MYMDYINISNKLLIRANDCEGDYVYVAFTIIVGDTHVVVVTIIPIINNPAYVYIAHIPMYIHICICSPKTAVHAHSTALSRPQSGHFAGDLPAFHQYHAEEIGYTTTIIFNWVIITLILNLFFARLAMIPYGLDSNVTKISGQPVDQAI